MNKPARFEDFRPYRVKVEIPDGTFYGHVDTLPRARAYFNRGDCVVQHAIIPKSYVIPISCITEIPYSRDPIGNPDEYDRHVRDEYERANTLSNSLGDSFAPGRLFSIGVADGQAWYVVTKVGSKNCTVEWRGFCCDGYRDQILEWGGSFPRRVIEPLARRHAGLRSIFGGGE